MVVELIFSAIFILSLAGASVILARKIPVLNALPYSGSTGIKKHHIILETENKIKNILLFFEKQIFMHKFLSWVKVMTLKFETRVDHSLHRIRKKAQQVDKKNKEKN
jgi:hypothetical protein